MLEKPDITSCLYSKFSINYSNVSTFQLFAVKSVQMCRQNYFLFLTDNLNKCITFVLALIFSLRFFFSHQIHGNPPWVLHENVNIRSRFTCNILRVVHPLFKIIGVYDHLYKDAWHNI